MGIYHMINWFFVFSLLGYLLECVVLTYENRKLVFNRGFGHGPFCIIYGFGALGAVTLLSPIGGSMVKLYVASMVMATVMELITAAMMIRLFGYLWWDYSKKPFNYKGIICLESSLAWGILGIIFIRFLNGFVYNLVGYVPDSIGKKLALGLVAFYFLDFVYCIRVRLRGSDEAEDGEKEPVIGRLKLY